MRTLLDKLFNKNPEELKHELNYKDERGLALIHYVCALNYHELIPILHEYGADIN